MRVYDSIILDKDSLDPLYIQLYTILRNLIENESIKPEDKLPPIRELCKKLGVNSVTVVNAYHLLEQKGYVYSKVGSGTFVKGKKYKLEPVNEQDMMDQGFLKINRGEINFSTLTPNPEYFPVSDFKEVLNEVLDRDKGYAFDYQELQGYYPLRESLKDLLSEKGISCDINNLHIISGAQQGIDIVSKIMVGYNDTIIIESPTYAGAIQAFKLRGANIVEVPILKDGMDMDELESVLKTTNPRMIYVMTGFQNPTGASYSEDKKLRLLYLAEKYNTYILEDDFMSELNYGRDELIPVKSLDVNERVIYVKSFSKTFMPGIRLGLMITPKNLSRPVMLAKHNTDISTSGLMQRAFDLYLRKNKWANHIKYMKNIYMERLNLIVNELKKDNIFSFENPLGGIHLWVSTDVNSSELGDLCKRMGLLIAPGRLFYLDERENCFFRLSIASVEGKDIPRGIEVIRSAYGDITMNNKNTLLPFL